MYTFCVGQIYRGVFYIKSEKPFKILGKILPFIEQQQYWFARLSNHDLVHSVMVEKVLLNTGLARPFFQGYCFAEKYTRPFGNY